MVQGNRSYLLPVSLHSMSVCIVEYLKIQEKVWPWVIPRNEAFLKLKTVGRKMTGRRYGAEPGLDCPFCISTLCETVFTSGASLLLTEFSLHINVFELHLSLGPLYSKGAAQTCQDMIPQNAGRLGVCIEIHVILYIPKKHYCWLFLASAQPSSC